MNELKHLVQTIDNHEAVNNAFYRKWMGGKIPLEHIAIFVRNYHEFTFRFPEALATLILNVDNVIARTEYTKTLYSEMGNGEPQRVHFLLFDIFCKDLSKHLGAENYLTIESTTSRFPLLPETKNFINGQKTLYSKEYSIAVGAQLALEWQAYTMIRKLYEGARNYMDMWPNQDAFHESCEFFYVHIGSAEKEHKEESIIAASKIIELNGNFNGIESGFNQHLNLIAAFWNAIAKEMDKH